MWKLLFTVLLTVGTEYLALYWTGCKKADLLSTAMSALFCICGCFAGNFIDPVPALLSALSASVTAFIIISVFRRNLKQAVPTAALMIEASFLYIPFADKNIWQYACAGLAILFITGYGGIYSFADKLEENWFSDLYDRNKKLYILLTLLPLIGAASGFGLSLAIASDSLLKLIIEISVLLLIIANTLILQRLAYCCYKARKDNITMEEWQRGARDYMNTIRSQRHDFNIHLHAIDGLIESGEFNECRTYISKMVEDANDVNDIMPVYDAMTGSMLYNMRHTAQNLGTNIYYDIKYDMKNVMCNAYECNKIIGNLIQNAIDASVSDEAKKHGIHVHIFKHTGNTIISVSNYFDGDPDSILSAFDLNYSTKKHHEGIGLSMVEKTLKKYGGKVFVEFLDKEITFIAHIPNKYLMEEKDDPNSIA